jgi:hypothetical protein
VFKNYFKTAWHNLMKNKVFSFINILGLTMGLPAARNFDMHYYTLYLSNTAICFNNMKLPDSALPYIQEAVTLGYERKDSAKIAGYLGEMGDTYIAMGQNETGRSFLRQSISVIKKINS